jgi:hypothetical protein
MVHFRFSAAVLFSICLAAVQLCGFHAAQGAATDISSLKDWLAKPRDQRPDVATLSLATATLTRDEAAGAKQLLWEDHVAEIKDTRRKEWDEQAITIGGHTLKLLEKTFGQKPKDGWNLFISMHGGGNAPPAVNDQQWQNQIKLYKPKDSLYIAPRAPTNTWNLWHEDHIDPLFRRLIEDAIVLGDVNPNRVYIMGYSAGGDGVYQLAPRMADSLAAASMMAGHPNDSSPLGLRDLPFTIHVGALDDGYGRNAKAAEWAGKLDALQKDDPDGYVHVVKLHEGRAHWMNLEDSVAVNWMLKFTRNPLPTKVVWMQGNAVHDRFYWLATPIDLAKKGQLVIVSRSGQTFNIEKVEGLESVTILLNDAMADLDQPIVITKDGRELFKGIVNRNVAEMKSTLADRGDPDLVFCAKKTVKIAG